MNPAVAMYSSIKTTTHVLREVVWSHSSVQKSRQFNLSQNGDDSSRTVLLLRVDDSTRGNMGTCWQLWQHTDPLGHCIDIGWNWFPLWTDTWIRKCRRNLYWISLRMRWAHCSFSSATCAAWSSCTYGTTCRFIRISKDAHTSNLGLLAHFWTCENRTKKIWHITGENRLKTNI